ncbi:MAG: hypothetical protein R3B89_17075 [Polyangiaceae bacterium]
MMLYLRPAEALHAQRNARLPCACTVHYPVLTTSGLTIDERALLLMVNGSLYLHEHDGIAVLARHFEETNAPLARKETPMPHISNSELQNLRRAAALGRSAAPRASASKPKPAPKADPHRAEKLKILAKVPATVRAELLKPGVSVATCREAAKVMAGEAAAPPKPHLELKPNGQWGLTAKAQRTIEWDRRMGQLNVVRCNIVDPNTATQQLGVVMHRHELDVARANGAQVTHVKAISR